MSSVQSTTSMPQSEKDYLTTSKFDTCDGLLKSVREFYQSKGYGISIRGSRKDKHMILQCDRSGVYRDIRGISGKRKKTTGSRLINCPFKIWGKKCSDGPDGDGAWIFDVKDLSHNHESSTDMSEHPSFRQLPAESIKSVGEMTKAGIPPRQILSSLRQQNPELPVISRNIYNVKRKIRKENLRNRPMINALFEELDEGGFTYDISHNTEGRISRLFIAHPLSIKLAKAFSNIFLMDCTYKTNKYNMPLLDIIGVSCFSTSFYAGFAFLEKEDEENYSWALRVFKNIIEREPYVIVTDRELALMNGIKNVFPTTYNNLCVWHIEKNVLANCKKYFAREEEFVVFMSCWTNVVYSITEALFEENWCEFASMNKDAVEYIQTIWLPWKEKFVSAWTDKYLHLDNRATSRAEGAHSKLKQYLQVSTGDLREVKEKICLAVEHEFNEIRVKLSSEKIHAHHDFNLPFFKELHYKISHFALKEIYAQHSFAKAGSLAPCTGHYMATMGLPCAHKIKYWQGTKFSLDLIHPQWRIDTLAPKLQKDLHDEGTGRLDELLNELRSTYQRWPSNKKEYALLVITELVNQSDTVFEPVIIRPKGRPRKSKKKRGITSTKRDPSRFELVESSQRRNEVDDEDNLFDLNVYPLDTFDLDGPF